MKRVLTVLIVLLSTLGNSQTEIKNKVISDSNFTIIEYETSSYSQRRLILMHYSGSTFDSSLLVLVDSLACQILSERRKDGTPFTCGVNLHTYPYLFQIMALKTPEGKKVYLGKCIR